jgi:regulator of sigma E protease
MLTFLAPVFVFGLVVFVHELGHFLAAKAMGVYAPRFSIGFGPALWRRRHGETEYVLAVLPIGGYVRMASRHDESAAMLEGGSEEQSKLSANDPDYDPEAMIPFGPKPVPENRWFESKPFGARLFILLAGVSMNVLLALVISIVLAAQFGRVTAPTRVVGSVHVPAGAPGLSALHSGDTIVSVNGETVGDWSDILHALARGGNPVTITTTRGPVVIPLSQKATAADVALAINYRVPPVLDSVVPDEPAARAGLRHGDSVVAIGDIPTPGFAELVERVSASPDLPLVFKVSRDGAVRDITVTPRRSASTDPETGAPTIVGRIGAGGRVLAVRVPLGFGEAVAVGGRATWATAGMIVGTVRDLITRKVSVRQLGGPIAIGRASLVAARSGIENLFDLIALLSLNVAILNMLPVPILDGGQILINFIETLKGSPFSLRARENMLRSGLVAIALLFAIVMWNDLSAWIGKLV